MNEPDFDPATAGQLLQQTEQKAKRSLDVSSPLLFSIWALAWGVGYLTTWYSARNLAADASPRPWALSVMGVAIGCAIAATLVVVIRGTRGVTGASRRAGILYGASWFIGFMTWSQFVAAANAAGANQATMGMLAAGGPALIVAVIYCVAAAVWKLNALFVAGALLALTVAAGVHASPSTLRLLLGTLGTAAFVVGAVWSAWEERHGRQQ